MLALALFSPFITAFADRFTPVEYVMIMIMIILLLLLFTCYYSTNKDKKPLRHRCLYIPRQSNEIRPRIKINSVPTILLII